MFVKRLRTLVPGPINHAPTPILKHTPCLARVYVVIFTKEKSVPIAVQHHSLVLVAGSGGLSRAVAAAGIPILPPNEFDSGGTDFRNKRSSEGLKKMILAFYTHKLTDA